MPTNGSNLIELLDDFIQKQEEIDDGWKELMEQCQNHINIGLNSFRRKAYEKIAPFPSVESEFITVVFAIMLRRWLTLAYDNASKKEPS